MGLGLLSVLSRRSLSIFGPRSAAVTISKTSDETVNDSATMQNDDELLFAVGANEVWHVIVLAVVNSGATPDIKFGWSVPAGAAILWGNDYQLKSLTQAQTLAQGTSGTDQVTTTMSGFVMTGATAGNVNLRWAQDTQDASDTKVLTNSCLIVRRLS